MDVTYPHRRSVRCGEFETGVTLIELLASLALIAVLISIAAPTLGRMVLGSQLTRRTNGLSRTIYLARESAVDRERRVVICKGNHRHCNRHQRWEQGWLVFADLDADHRHDSGEPILAVQPPMQDGTHIALRAFGSVNYIVFHPSGFTRTNGTFTICEGNRQQALVYSKTGRVRLSTGDPDDCP